MTDAHPSPEIEKAINAIVRWAYDQGAHDGLKHGPIVTSPRWLVSSIPPMPTYFKDNLLAALSQRGRDEAIEAFVKYVADQPDGRPTASRAMRLNDIIEKARSLVSDDKERGSPSEDAGPV